MKTPTIEEFQAWAKEHQSLGLAVYEAENTHNQATAALIKAGSILFGIEEPDLDGENRTRMLSALLSACLKSDAAHISKEDEKRHFCGELVKNILNQIIQAVPNMPEEWDEHELRRYVADRFEIEVTSPLFKDRTRYKEYVEEVCRRELL